MATRLPPASRLPAPEAAAPAAPAVARVLELRQFDVLQISSVDTAQHLFKAQIFMQFCFPGGATDKELCAPAETDDSGRVVMTMSKSTAPAALTPSAWWYMDQIEVRCPTAYRLCRPPTTYHLPPTTYRLPPTACRLSTTLGTLFLPTRACGGRGGR
jgi:hypothetical protein